MRTAIVLGAAFAFAGVAAGAFGAHGLKTRLSPELLATYEVAVRYQLVHALGLIAIGVLEPAPVSRLLVWAARAMALGIVLFSGSLYALTLLGAPRLGIVTPFGGVAFLVGWALLLVWGLGGPRALGRGLRSGAQPPARVVDEPLPTRGRPHRREPGSQGPGHGRPS